MKRPKWILAWSAALFAAAIVLGIAAPAQAVTGATGYSGCVRTSPSDRYTTYGTADNTTNRAYSTTRRVDLDATGIGRSYDCGPGGRTQNVPKLKVAITYIVSGSQVNCSATGGFDGHVSFSCATNKSETRVTDEYTCENTWVCEVSDSGISFTAASGGTITRIDVEVKVTISGSGGAKSANSNVRAFG